MTTNNQNENEGTSNAADAMGRLWSNGVLMDLSVRYFRARQGLQPEDVQAAPERLNALVKLGYKTLFEDETLLPLRKAEAKARNALLKRSLRFPVGGARFVPFGALPQVREDLEEARAEFQRAAEAFMAAYEAGRDAMLKKYPELLRPDDYPPVEALTFRMDYHGFTMASAAQEAGYKVRNVIEEFVRDSVQTLRQKVLEVVSAQRERLETGKPVSERQLNSLRRLIDEFKSLNFVGDAPIEARLAELRQTLNLRTAKAYKDDLDAQKQLSRVLDLVTDAATDDSSFSESVGTFVGRVVQVDATVSQEVDAAAEA